MDDPTSGPAPGELGPPRGRQAAGEGGSFIQRNLIKINVLEKIELNSSREAPWQRGFPGTVPQLYIISELTRKKAANQTKLKLKQILTTLGNEVGVAEKEIRSNTIRKNRER